jgi:hypothetical protein
VRRTFFNCGARRRRNFCRAQLGCEELLSAEEFLLQAKAIRSFSQAALALLCRTEHGGLALCCGSGASALSTMKRAPES